LGVDTPAPLSGEGPNDKPFDDKPFDAGVQADEKIQTQKSLSEQLTGKLGQSLRKSLKLKVNQISNGKIAIKFIIICLSYK